MLTIHLWNVAAALQRQNGMRLYAKVPNGHVKVVSLSLLEQLQSDYNLKNYQENNNVSDQLTFQAFDQ